MVRSEAQKQYLRCLRSVELFNIIHHILKIIFETRREGFDSGVQGGKRIRVG